MAAALSLSMRGRGRTASNPNVGCVIVRENIVIGRGWTQPGGRPHAEAMALDDIDARGADVYVTLEPCAHESRRGRACADLLVEAGVRRVIIGMIDIDPRTDGLGVGKLRRAGIEVVKHVLADEARRAMAGFFVRQKQGRPHVTLKLATSLDGQIAMPDGSSQWITGEEARAHAHVERSLADIVIVGRTTALADEPKLDVRIAGLTERTPKRAMLTREHSNFSKFTVKANQPDWIHLPNPQAVAGLETVNFALVEGGAGAASAFLAAGLVDRLVLYRAPILIGAGMTALGDIGLNELSDAHGQWHLTETRMLGRDRMEVYERA